MRRTDLDAIARRSASLLVAGTPALARATDEGEHPWIAWTILVAVGLFVAGILVRAALGSSTPPGWLAFLARRRSEGRTTRWREWPDD